VAFLKESTPGVYRASLRSKGDINVARIAEKFGGGGHRNAAGCTLTGSWEEAEHSVVNLLTEAVARRNGERDGDDNGAEEVILPTETEKRRPEAHQS
jgi:phosphoesterase RecJ-like protein